MKTSFSAPAKVILSGEHAVVYGKPAFVSAVQLYLTCTVDKASAEIKDDKFRHITDAVREYLRSHKISFADEPASIRISSAIPVGRGLGSSAALSVAAVAALLTYYAPDEKFTQDTINSLAYKVEKMFHKNPSGVDNSAATFGGLLYYRKEFEFLKCISALTFKIPPAIEQNLYLIDTGKPKESTADMVNHVGTRYNQDTAHIEELMNKIEKTTRRMVVAIIKEDPIFFNTCISDNHDLLMELGVVSPKAVAIINDLKPYGVGKITGAGGIKNGSGFILFSCVDKKEFEQVLNQKNLKFIKFKQDYTGFKANQ